jgi:hypothetical protein
VNADEMPTRAELVERLAEVSHATWMRQKSRDQGAPSDELDPAVTAHDRERAEDTVAELERLGVLRDLGA